MKWVHKDEYFTWGAMDLTDEESSNRKSFPEFYAYINNDLFNRLAAAWAELDKVLAEVELCKGAERS